MKIIIRSFGVVAVYMATFSIAFAEPILVSMQPWGSVNDQQAMDQVFGVGNWALYNDYVTADPSAIFIADNNFVYLQGSAGTDLALASYLAANETDILDWVTAGGSLLLESAGWNTGITFGPAALDMTSPSSYSATGYLTDLGMTVFNYFPIEDTERRGNFLGHDAVVLVDDVTLYPFIEGINSAGDTNVVVGGIPYGDGYITMSGLTLFQYHSDMSYGSLGADGSSWLLNMIGGFNDASALASAVKAAGGSQDLSQDLREQSVLERVLGKIDSSTNLAKVNGTFANIADNIGGPNGEGIDGSITNVVSSISEATQVAIVRSAAAAQWDSPTLVWGDMSTTALGAVNTGDIVLGVNQVVDQAKTETTGAYSAAVSQLGGSSLTGTLVLNEALNMTGINGSITNVMYSVNASLGDISTTALGVVSTGGIVSGVDAVVSGIVGATGTGG